MARPIRRMHRRHFDKGPGTTQRTTILALVISLLAPFALIIGTVTAVYAHYSRELPSPEAMIKRPLPISTRIYDRHGELLHETFDPQVGKRTLVPLSQISKDLINATIATEDADFYRHQGINIRGIMRAAISNFIGQGDLQGGSSITQQLVKNVLIPENERQSRSLSRKVKEFILAYEASQRYSKDQILEWYLNEIYYGNLSYGIEAAAESYFGKSAKDLTLSESALLAGLPRGPSLYSPLESPKLAKARQEAVLDMMVRQEYITEPQAEEAKKEELHFAPQRFPIKAPHFVMYVRELLQKKYGIDLLLRGGLRVITTIDLKTQEEAERIIEEQSQALKTVNAHNAALVALKPQTGEILAMVGSKDYFDPDISGQINMTVAERQPGSSFKPFTYLPAFMKGYTPATMLLDVPTTFPDGTNPPYRPENVDGTFRGPVPIRQALANSINIPAVRALQFAGIREVINTAHAMGITTLNKGPYGLSLTLGGGEVKLLDMAYAYGVFANGGVMAGVPVPTQERVPGMRELEPVAILKVTNAQGKVLEEFSLPQTKTMTSPQLAYLLTNILSDNKARTPLFGPNSLLKLSRPAAVKTGTTDDWRDFWTVGYTPDLVAGVWVGNSNYQAMKKTYSVLTATPIWHNFMEAVLKNTPAKEFPRPDDLEEIVVCATSGLLPTADCPATTKEIFVKGTSPNTSDNIFRTINIDRRTGALATNQTPPEAVEEKKVILLPPDAAPWAQEKIIEQPGLEYSGLGYGTVVSNTVVITYPWSEGVARAITNTQMLTPTVPITTGRPITSGLPITPTQPFTRSTVITGP